MGISIFSFAEKTVSRATYETEVDKLNCELAKYYMKKNQGLDTLRNYQYSLAITGCNFEHLMVFIKERQPEMKLNGELAVYIESLKENYEGAVNNNVLYQKVTDIFEQPILNVYSNDDDFVNLEISLKDGLKENLKIKEIGNIVNQEVAEQKGFFESFRGFGWQEATLSLITILIIFIFVSLISWFYKYSTTGKATTSTVNRSQAEPPTSPIPIPPTPLITTGGMTINDSHTTPEPKVVLTPPLQNDDVPIVVANVPIIDPPIDDMVDDVEDDNIPNEDIFYMPYPTIDGSFYEYGKHETYEEGRSTFKFEIKLKEYNLATFEVISNQDVITDALMNFEKTLNAVCEVIGEGTKHDENHEIIIKPGLKKIVVIEPGTAQLRTQHWRLKQKAKIRLEY